MNRQSINNHSIDIDSIILRMNKLQINNSNAAFPLQEQQIQALCSLTRLSMSAQPMLLQLKPPINICGDIHGQFRDLLTLISVVGDPSEKNYLFLGDYVDRGKRSLECFCLLMAYKVKHPNNFFMLRGNHQCSQVNKIYGFFDQCKRKFNLKIWKSICDTFDYLPIAAVVGDRIFCVHGGLSPQLRNIRDLNAIKRPVQPLRSSALCDMLWSDPSPLLQGWNQNIDRGVSFYFGANIVNNFLQKYDFDLICRSHQVVQQGYQFFNDRKLITVFSAPNYCGDFQNLGAVLKVDQNMKCSIIQFQSIIYPTIIKKPKRSLTPIPQSKKDISPIKNKHQQNTSPIKQSKPKESQQANKQNKQSTAKQSTTKQSTTKPLQKKSQDQPKPKNQRKVTNIYMLKKQLDLKHLTKQQIEQLQKLQNEEKLHSDLHTFSQEK